MLDGRGVKVKSALQEDGTDVLEVGTRGPEPVRHATSWSGGDEISEGKWLLENLTNLEYKSQYNY